MFTAFRNDDRSFWKFFAAFSGVIALLKGLQLPSVVPATQAQLDYSAGLIKRGLFGTLAEHLHLPIYHYHVFAVIAYLTLAAACAAAVWATWRSGLSRSQLGLLACAVFFSSYATTYFASLVGRFDIIQMGVTVLIVSIRRPAVRNAILLVASPLCILLHENFFLAFLPVCLLPTVLEGLAAPDRPRPRLGLGLGVAALVISVITVAVLAARTSADPAALEALYSRVTGHIDFEPDDTLVGILARGVGANLAVMSVMTRIAGGYRGVDFVFSCLTFFPSCAYLLFCARALLAPLGRARSGLAIAAVVICVLPPLALNGLGSDMDRWNAFIVFNGFAALLAASRLATARGLIPVDPAPVWTRAAIVLVATNLASGGGLLEYKCIKPYPFRTHVQTLYEELHGHAPAQPKKAPFLMTPPC